MQQHSLKQPVSCRNAVAEFLAETLALVPDAFTGAHIYTRMDWPAVLRMMLQQRCIEHGQHQWLALSLCTICVGLIIRTAGDVVKLDLDVIRNARKVLLEALSSDRKHDDEQAACVLKVLCSASFKGSGISSDQVKTPHQNTTDIILRNVSTAAFARYNGSQTTVMQASTCPQTLAVYILEQMLQLPQITVTGIANQDVWEQLVLSWSAIRSNHCATNHEPQELQYASTHIFGCPVLPAFTNCDACLRLLCRLCMDTAAVISRAAMCSCLRSSVLAALQQVPPDSIVPAAELLVTQSLPDPSDMQHSSLPKAVKSIIRLLLNVTHQSWEMSQCCGSPVPLLHLARSVHCACRVLAKSKSSHASDDGHADLKAYLAALLCLLINIVENSSTAGVQLAQMDMATADTAPSVAPPHGSGKSASEPACKDIVNPGNFHNPLQAPCRQPRVQSVPAVCPHVDAVADFQNAMFDDFRAKEDDLVLMSASQTSGLQVGSGGRAGSSHRRMSAVSSSGRNPRSKKRNSLTAVPSPTDRSPNTLRKVR